MKNIGAFIVALLAIQACGGGSNNSAVSTPTPPPVTNNPPQAADQATLTSPNTAVVGTLMASDADGDTLSYTVDSGPASGMVTLSGSGNQDFEYTPNAGFSGTDSFTFTASDGNDSSAAATVTVVVNSRPVAIGTSATTSEIIDIIGQVMATDGDGDSVTFAVSSQPTKGTLGTFDAISGAFTYSPDPAQDGVDTFAVTAADAFQASVPANVDVEIFRWSGTQQFGTPQGDFVITGGMLRGSDGSLTFGGVTTGLIAGTANAGGRDAFVRKVDRRGGELWTVQLGDARENSSRNILDNPLGDGFYLVINGDFAAIYRFDDDGNELWNTAVDFTPFAAQVNAYWSNIDGAGDIYVLSWTSIPSGLGSLITKVSGVDGSVIWQRELRPSEQDAADPYISDTVFIQARGIDFDSSGNLIIAGSFNTSSGIVPRNCARCSFLASFDANGNELWLREPESFATACNTTTDGRVFRVTVAPDDSLYLIGAGNWLSGVGGPDGRVARYSADGTQLLWAYCDDTGDSMSFNFTPVLLAADGGLLAYGSIESPMDPVTLVSEFSDVVVTRLDSAGNELWRQVISGTRADGTEARLTAGSIAEDSQGLIYVNGSTNGELTSSAGLGAEDGFLIRLDADGTVR